jgi:hypothetical protein
MTSTGELQIMALCQSTASQSSVRVAFRLLNASDKPFAFGDIMMRYYFSYMLPAGDVPVLGVDYAERFQIVDITGAFSSGYAEIGFVPTVTAELAASDNVAGSGEMQVHLHTTAFSDWNSDQSDDYSYDPCGAGDDATTWTPRPTMTAYVRGKLAWGVEP